MFLLFRFEHFPLVGRLGAVTLAVATALLLSPPAQTLAVTPQALQMIDDARDKGVQVQAEIYPYSYGSTIVGADYLHPDNYQKNMGGTTRTSPRCPP